MRPTLIFLHHTDLGDRKFRFGEELPPGVLPATVVDQWLDSGRLKEYPERRSLYRVFAPFSGCKEREQLTEDELTSYSLPK